MVRSESPAMCESSSARAVWPYDTLITYVLCQPTHQLFVSRFELQQPDSVMAPGDLPVRIQQVQVLLHGGQHMTGAHEVIALDQHSPKLGRPLDR